MKPKIFFLVVMSSCSSCVASAQTYGSLYDIDKILGCYGLQEYEWEGSETSVKDARALPEWIRLVASSPLPPRPQSAYDIEYENNLHRMTFDYWTYDGKTVRLEKFAGIGLSSELELDSSGNLQGVAIYVSDHLKGTARSDIRYLKIDC